LIPKRKQTKGEIVGWNSTAFVFGQEPNWDSIAGSKMAMRGYAHKKEALWLLAVSPRELNKYEPFVDAVGRTANKSFLRNLDDQSKQLIEKLIEIEADLGKELAGSLSVSFIAHAAEVQKLACVPTYYFSGDDEGHDIGISFSQNHISLALQISRTPLAFVARKKKYSILINKKALDGEFSETVFHEPVMNAIKNWQAEGALTVKNASGNLLKLQNSSYGFAADQWPAKWGDPAKLAGVGTWDLFQNLNADYRIVVERKSPSGSLVKKRSGKK